MSNRYSDDPSLPSYSYPPSSSPPASASADASSHSPHLSLPTHRVHHDEKEDDELLAAEELLAHRASSAHFPSSSSSPSHLRARQPRWWARTTTWIAISAALFVALLTVGGGAAHPAVREYVGNKVDQVTGLSYAAGAGGSRVEYKERSEWWDEEQFWRDVRAGRKANATITILVNPRSNLFQDLLPTLTNVEARFNGRFGYPIQLLTDGQLPSEALQNRTSWVTKGKARWSLVTESQGWGPPTWITDADIEQGRNMKMGNAFPLGYHNMCRFFSKYHSQHPALKKFEYIWRLDEGIEFFCELQNDPFMTMERTDSLYGYNKIMADALFTMPTLWEHTEKFMTKAKEDHPDWFPAGRNEALVSTANGTFIPNIYYNNFEIVHRSFLESDAYTAYVDYLDHAKGFYTERWGDAPVRTIALSHFVSSDRIHNFDDETAYKHDHVPYPCPDQPYCYCSP